jgi:WD40 repeat protein
MTLFAGVTLGQQAPYVYDVVEGTFLSEPTLAGPAINIDSLAFAPDGRTLAGVGEGRVILWDVRAGTALNEELRGVPGGVEESPSDSGVPSEFFRGPVAVGRDVVVAGDWRGVVVFDLSSHTLLRSVHVTGATPLEDVPNVIRGLASAAFSPGGRLLAWTLANQDSLEIEVVVWDLQRDQELMRVPTAGGVGLEFSPDGSTLAVRAFSEEEGFTLVNLASGDLNEVATLPWKAASPRGEAAARTTPWTVEAGGLGASIGFDGTLTLWDTERGQPLGTVDVPGAFDFSALVFAPQGRQLAVASPGGALSIIDTEIRSWHRKACELAGRSLTDEEWNRHIGRVGDLQRSC